MLGIIVDMIIIEIIIDNHEIMAVAQSISVIFSRENHRKVRIRSIF